MNRQHAPEDAQETLEQLMRLLLEQGDALRSIADWLGDLGSTDPRVTAAVTELRAAALDLQTARTRLAVFTGPRAKARLNDLGLA